jgi:hypothetical protein
MRGDVKSSWLPVDLEPYLAEDAPLVEPEVLTRTDGQHLFYRGRTNLIFGDPEAGKSLLALLAAKSVLDNGGTIVVFDFEDSPRLFVDRLHRQFGVSADVIRDQVIYVRPDEPLTSATAREMVAMLEDAQPDLIIVDATSAALDNQGSDSMTNADFGMLHRLLLRRLADVSSEPGVLIIDHTGHTDKSRPAGGHQKMSRVDGAAYLLRQLKPFGHGIIGRASLTLKKDRPGAIRGRGTQGNNAGTFTLWSDPELVVLDASIEAPELAGGRAIDRDGRPDLEDAILVAIETLLVDHPKGVSGRGLHGQVGGNKDDFDHSLKQLETAGRICHNGKKGSASGWLLPAP